MTETILQEAERIINGDRQGSYGPPEQSLGDIANLWSPYLGKEISAQDVANLMILLKVSRSKRGFHRDSFVDIAGYAGLTEKLVPKPVPEWASLYDIPKDTEVVDKDGHSWRWRTGNTAAEYLSPVTSPWGAGFVWVRVGNAKSSSHYHGPFKLKESNS